MAPSSSPAVSHADEAGRPNGPGLRSDWLAPRPRRLSRRVAFPLISVLLSAAAPAGLLAVRLAAATRHAPMATWLAAELRGDAAAYAYVASFTLGLLLVVGWVFGRREDRLRAAGISDPLTGLANRRHLQTRLDEELHRSSRHGTPLSLLVIDVDYFRMVNDRQGPRVGDAVLRFVAAHVRGSCRRSDFAARRGADQFAVVAPNTRGAEALVLANAIRERVRRLSSGQGNVLPSLSVSIGVTDVELAGAFGAVALGEAADRALHRAKLAGRDCAVLATPVPTQTLPRDVRSHEPPGAAVAGASHAAAATGPRLVSAL